LQPDRQDLKIASILRFGRALRAAHSLVGGGRPTEMRGFLLPDVGMAFVSRPGRPRGTRFCNVSRQSRALRHKGFIPQPLIRLALAYAALSIRSPHVYETAQTADFLTDY
jgi:hypothetical protein